MKTLVLSILLTITLQANASIGDWFEKIANKAVGLDTSIVTMSNLKYSNRGRVTSSSNIINVTGRMLNTSNTETIKTIVFKYEILECNASGENCTTIGETENRWDTNIPPKQARFFDHLIAQPEGASGSIFYRQNIKYIYPYSDM